MNGLTLGMYLVPCVKHQETNALVSMEYILLLMLQYHDYVIYIF